MESNKEELFVVKDEATQAILTAITKMYALVGSTMGPAGKTVIIPDTTSFGKYTITKDGVSVSKVVKSNNPYEQIVINLLKEVTKNVVNVAGDGTTTSIALAYSLFINLMKARDLDFKIFDEALEETIKHLDSVKTKLKNKDIHRVALISANGEESIANIIDEAYSNSKVVNVMKSTKDKDSISTYTGIYLPTVQIVSPVSVVKERAIKEASILVANKNITNSTDVDSIIKYVKANNKPLVVIANDVSSSIISHFETLDANGSATVVFIKSPGFATQRVKLLSDIATYVGCEMLNEDSGKITTKHISDASVAVTLTKTSSQIYNPKADVRDLITVLESELEATEDDLAKDLITQRIERLQGISIIHVGGSSETEVNERFDRYEDAIRAVSCALEDGVIEGGGLTLAKYAIDKLKELEYNPEVINIKNPLVLYYISLVAPFETIVRNGHQLTIESNLIEEGIYDPVKVTKTALIQSYNFVKLLLKVDSIIMTKDGEQFYN